jgi:hypothetical protein
MSFILTFSQHKSVGPSLSLHAHILSTYVSRTLSVSSQSHPLNTISRTLTVSSYSHPLNTSHSGAQCLLILTFSQHKSVGPSLSLHIHILSTQVSRTLTVSSYSHPLNTSQSDAQCLLIFHPLNTSQLDAERIFIFTSHPHMPIQHCVCNLIFMYEFAGSDGECFSSFTKGHFVPLKPAEPQRSFALPPLTLNYSSYTGHWQTRRQKTREHHSAVLTRRSDSNRNGQIIIAFMNFHSSLNYCDCLL